MKTESAAAADVRRAAVRYDASLVRAAQHVRAKTMRRHATNAAPWMLAAAALALVVLPKRLRRPVLGAAMPLLLASAKSLIR
jgi:hypothetical protein